VALGASDEPTDQVTNVVQTVRELGLAPSPAPEPLPLITQDEIHLVCWLAIVGSDDSLSLAPA
jgi:hypothetical protein